MFGAGVVYLSWEEIDFMESKGWECGYPLHVERGARQSGVPCRTYEQNMEAIEILYLLAKKEEAIMPLWKRIVEWLILRAFGFAK